MSSFPGRHRSPVFHIRNSSSDSSSSEDDPPIQIGRSTTKPLKSSLKSSSSSPNIPLLHTLNPNLTRPRSAPSSPCSTPKNVHFPSRGLETIRLFSISAKPASLSSSLSHHPDDTETETDSDASRGFPFPTIPSTITYHIDITTSSPIPAPHPSPYANVHIESIALSIPLALSGTLLVRNLAYEKSVAVRFTLDDWNTTSEVKARHLQSLPALPQSIFHSGSGLGLTPPTAPTDLGGPETHDLTWDRFAFSIRLEDYAPTLERRTIWLVARVGAGAEWWDNNTGRNYRVAFKVEPENDNLMLRRTTVSAPSSFHPHPPSLSIPTIVSPSVSPTTPTAHPLPNPSSAQNSALAQTTISRLRKLSLTNYAAPSTLTQNDNNDHNKPKGSMHVEGWEYAAPSGIMATRKEVYWPWGTTSHLPPSPEEKEKANDNDTIPTPAPAPAAVVSAITATAATAAAATPSSPGLTLRLPPRHRHAPRRSSPLSSPLISPSGKGKRVFSPQTDISRGGSTRVSLEEPVTPDTPSVSNSPSPSPSPSPSLSMSPSISPSPSPSSPLPSKSPSPSPLSIPSPKSPSPSPLIRSTSPSQLNILAPAPAPSLDTDSVYQAFVRKWCFAGSAGGAGGNNSGSSPGADETAVGVGVPGVGVGVGVGVGGAGVSVNVSAVTPRMGVSPAPPGDGVYPGMGVGVGVGVGGYVRERGEGVVGF